MSASERTPNTPPAPPRRSRSAREPDRVPVFLSAPKPVKSSQQDFLEQLCRSLTRRRLHPRTLGVTDYDTREPLAGVYGVLAQCYGVVTVAFARTEIRSGRVLREWRPGDPAERVGGRSVSGLSFTSPWSHIEAAMAYALGLPMIILRESGVYGDGVLQEGVAGIYLPEFQLDRSAADYLREPQAQGYLDAWTHQVQEVVRNRTEPPRHYRRDAGR